MNFIITNIIEQSLKDNELLTRHLAMETENHKYKFKMFDDDGNLYYEGYSKINYTFEPLDDFGRNAGCTEIHYLENNNFIRL